MEEGGYELIIHTQSAFRGYLAQSSLWHGFSICHWFVVFVPIKTPGVFGRGGSKASH